MIHMQMGEEDVVDLRHRHLVRDDVLQAAGPEVEEESAHLAAFHHDARAGLAEPRRV
jgi:hypothetical protein